MRAYGLTDKGVIRPNNQDAIYCSKDKELPLYIIADGMGGHKAGEVASNMAISIISSSFMEDKDNLQSEEDIVAKIRSSIAKANKSIYMKSLSEEEYSGMGTTVTLAYLVEGQIYIGHVGDSRAYHIEKNKIRQITEDHSLVNEMVKSGSISREEGEKHPQKNIITRAVGTGDCIDVDILTLDCSGQGYLFLCTDGLSNLVTEEEILQAFNVDQLQIDKACQNLVGLAKERGGFDNISVLAIQLENCWR